MTGATINAALSGQLAGDCRLLAKYDVSGPRYTSYPTAAQFRSGFDGRDFLNAVYSDTDSITPLSLYIHIPFCENICYYCACNKMVTRDKSVVQKYLDYLHREMALLHLQLKLHHRPVTQLHWGGGTPTFLSDGEMTKLMHMTAQHFHLIQDPQRDYAIEIDPRSVNNETIDLLRGLGFNRISLGIQDFDPAVQQAINRIQTPEMISDLVSYIRARAFRSLNFDLIYGLPCQTEITLEHTLDQVIAMAPDRISYYNYAHLPERFLSQRAIDRLTLPTAEQKLRLLSLIIEKLTAAGYLYIGMDHFVKPDDSLAIAQREGHLARNFQGYTIAKSGELIGMGVSAISSLSNVYTQNNVDLDGWYAMLDESQLPITKGIVLTEEDKLRRDVIQEILCYRSLDIQRWEQQTGFVFREHFANALPGLEDMVRDGLLTLEADRLQVTVPGYPFLRNLAMLFDEYLASAQASGQARYSRAI